MFSMLSDYLDVAPSKFYNSLNNKAKDELIVELETDKVTLEVNAPSNGVIADLKVKEGDNVKVGDLIALMSEGGAFVKAAHEPVAQKAVAATQSVSTSPHRSAGFRQQI
jgi:2-oxoglutarate dehydrogenase E2 component (dihydrolipoamide succinyltransferase)